jgi:hypothetical protein
MAGNDVVTEGYWFVGTFQENTALGIALPRFSNDNTARLGCEITGNFRHIGEGS